MTLRRPSSRPSWLGCVSQPVTPSTTSSGRAPTAVARTGTPTDAASRATRPNGSSHSEGTTSSRVRDGGHGLVVGGLAPAAVGARRHRRSDRVVPLPIARSRRGGSGSLRHARSRAGNPFSSVARPTYTSVSRLDCNAGGTLVAHADDVVLDEDPVPWQAETHHPPLHRLAHGDEAVCVDLVAEGAIRGEAATALPARLPR